MTKTAADVKKELKKRRQKRSKVDWYKLEGGSTKYIRIGPPWKKDGECWKDVAFHGFFTDKVYCRKNDIDPKTDKPRMCPVCVRLKELKSDRSPKGKKLWSLIRQNTEGLWNILVVKKFKRVNGKVKVKRYLDNRFKVFRLSAKWQALMMDIFADEDYRSKHILGVTHSKYGRLIKATREGKGRDDTNYSFRPVDHMSPILPDKEDRQKLLKTLNDLDAIVHGSSKEECEAFLEKMEKKAKRLAHKERDRDEDEEEEDEDEEEETEDDNEDDEDGDDAEPDDDDDESDSDDEEDESDLEKNYKKLKKQHKKKKRHHDDDEDGEDEEEEDDDE